MSRLDPEQKEQIKKLLSRKENVLCRQGIATKEMLQAMSAAIRVYNTKVAKVEMDELDDAESGDIGDLGISTPQREIRDEEIQGLIHAALEDPNSEAFKQLPEQLQNYVQELIKAKAKAQEQEAEIKSKTDAEAEISRPKEKMKAGYRPRPQR